MTSPLPPRTPDLPRFFVAGDVRDVGSRPGQAVALAEGEDAHARRALRLAAGDTVLGLDGCGGSWILALAEGEGTTLVEPLPLVPEPGRPGAPLPWIEVCVAWPRKTRGEPMLGTLTQLGVAAIRPLAANHRGAAPVPEEPPERWWKIVREACKQSERLWLPELLPPVQVGEVGRSDAAIALLDPRRGMSLDTWTRSLQPEGTAGNGLGSKARPIVLVIGPEGGFAQDEEDVLHAAGATSVRLAPHVLRIETAAAAALAVCVTSWMS